MQSFEDRVRDLVTHLSTEDMTKLTTVSLMCLVERERQDKEKLILENQNLHYKSACRLKALQDNGIADPFGPRNFDDSQGMCM